MVSINKNRCVGCGICANICPEGIEMVAEKAKIKNENAECLKTAADACPKKAIILNEENSNDENKSYDYNPRMGQGRGLGAGRGRGLGIGPKDGRGSGRGGRGRKI